MGNAAGCARRAAGAYSKEPQNAAFVKEREPAFQWKIYGFSALLQRGATSVTSDLFHYGGHTWYLQVTPMEKKGCSLDEPFVAANLVMDTRRGLKEDIMVDTIFELSIYNHSRGTHHGTRASYKFHYPNYYSEHIYLIPLSKLLDGSDFLVDDTCVFGLDILRARKFTPARNDKGVTIQHVFLQTKGFMQGNYTWNIEDSKLDLKSTICSPKFDVGEHKWYLRADPFGYYRNHDYVSIYLCLDNPNMPPIESAIMVEFTVSILNQKDGKHSQQKGRTVFSWKGTAWGWHKFIRRDQMKNTDAGFVVGSSWTVQAEVTVIGSSSHAW